MKLARRMMTILGLLGSTCLIARLCVATTTNIYTSVPSTSVAQSGVNTNNQSATWTTSGHIRREHTGPGGDPLMQVYQVLPLDHFYTVCNFNGTEAHKDAIRVGFNSGAGGYGDGVQVALWMDQRTYKGAQVDQTWGLNGNGIYALFDANDVNFDFEWSDGKPDDVTLAVGEELRYAVGTWQGDSNDYNTIVITGPL
jgi:hypothetical protein